LNTIDRIYAFKVKLNGTSSLSNEHVAYCWASIIQELNLMSGAEETLHFYLIKKFEISAVLEVCQQS
jgi:hypothetical protein